MNQELNFILDLRKNGISIGYSNPTAKTTGTLSYTINDVRHSMEIQSVNFEKAMLIDEIYNLKSESDVLKVKTFCFDNF